MRESIAREYEINYLTKGDGRYVAVQEVVEAISDMQPEMKLRSQLQTATEALEEVVEQLELYEATDNTIYDIAAAALKEISND